MKPTLLPTTLVLALALAVPVTTPAVAAPPASPASAAATRAGAPLAVATATKPKATVTTTYTTLRSGKVQVVVTSNAAKVQVKYRTAKNKKRALNRKLKRGRVTFTLPTGSKTITVRAKATSKLATSPWTPATPPAVAPPVVTPPVVTPPAVTGPPATPPAPDTTPPGPVSGLTVTATTQTSITLIWTNPTDADLAAIIVRRDGTQVYSGLGTAFVDAGLTTDTGYTYSVSTGDTTGNTSPGVPLTQRTKPLSVDEHHPAELVLASIATDGAQGEGDVLDSAVAANGMVVAFTTEASGLVSGDTNGKGDVYVRDRQSGTTTRVSVASDGTQAQCETFSPLCTGGWWGSGNVGLSADGRYVVFESSATNLVAADTNDESDVFLHDRQTGTTTRVSRGMGGAEANGSSTDPAISADGRHVAFSSTASNLVPGDTNNSTLDDVFVLDTPSDTTTRLSVSSAGAQANDSSWSPSISTDGQFVSFASQASNLVPGDTNGYNAADVFVHNRQTAETTRVSLASDGSQASGWSDWPDISGDGRFVAFQSGASDLVAGDSNETEDVFVHDRQTGATTRVSVASDGTPAPTYYQSYGEPAISWDGRYVVFTSSAPNLVPTDSNSAPDVFVHDRESGTTTRVSVTAGGAQVDGESAFPAISGDGRYITFMHNGSPLVPGDINGWANIYLARMW